MTVNETITDEADAIRAAQQNVAWDGKGTPYKPDRDIPIATNLTMHHADSDVDLDPITFEVLSTKLWNINEEHADTIQRVSGSPVVVENYDFNTCIMTEQGEPFLFAPYIQYFAGAAEYLVKYTLENRSENPGIEPGDVFLSNDCLIGGSHQMDVGVYAPVFVDGKLFCWVFNACHARDTGGVEPGSFCVQAKDIYWDPPMMRAVKFADRRGIRSDIEDTLMRFSRIPEIFALEIRSQLAGINRARSRIENLFTTYSPDIVKAAMNKLIDDAEATARERLQRVPDGRWTDVVYCGGAYPGDRDVHKTVVTLEKRGDSLYFNNYGTDPQVAAFNCGFGQWRSAIACALTHMLVFDHKFCVGGVLRLCEFDAEIGTISTVDRDGAFSTLHPQVLTVAQSERVVGKMLYPDPEQRRHMMATSALATCGWVTTSGIDQWGSPFATVTLDHTAGGQGAFATRDGLDQGGTPGVWPKSESPDVEAWEQYFPILYLYRSSVPNCGHGKFRGGNGIAFAQIGHGSDQQNFSTVSVASGTPVSSGLLGGLPGISSTFYAVGQSDVRERFDRGELPASPEAIRTMDGDGRQLPAKSNGLPLGTTDVIEQNMFGGGGYGDPLERDLERVASDLAELHISRSAATDIYGVAIGSDGRIDDAATQTRREEIRAARLGAATPPARKPTRFGPFKAILEIAEALAIADVDGTPTIVCTRGDGTALCSVEENYKEHVAVLETSLIEIDADLFTDPALDTDADVVYRQYLCPATGTLLDSELTLRGEPPVWDIRLDPATLPG